MKNSSQTFSQFNIQDALSVFNSEQKELIKLIIGKVISEKIQQNDVDDHNPSTLAEIKLN